MKFLSFTLFFFCFSFLFQLNAQNFLSTKGKAIVNENQDTILLRGMGLGGWMVQEGYMLQTAGFANPQHKIKATIQELIGGSNTEAFYDAWLSNHVRKPDIDSLKSWGFNSVRLPMHYNLFTLPIEEEPIPGQHTWLEKGFELTDSLISWCKQNDMYVILDLHAAPGGQGYDAGISDYDDGKPSLWESKENRDKMVALWKRIAERYSNEEWVAGYDLLNEPNWDLPGGVALRNLYEEVTDSIRTVDTNHILFIEGNWFANDFTGLTPPWDDKLVYSPHKYWSFNDKETMKWVLDIRNAYDVPLYLGESGENSNVWFRDAIRLLEDLDIGWAWWPMKKIDAIAGPLSVVKTPEYQLLLDYWNGSGAAPTEQFAVAALMEIAEGLKIENCIFQKDVIDAMFRQVYSDETVPYNLHQIPGVLYATDFDMGRQGKAYYDSEVATYHVSTSNYTAWNNGWSYRNDGVDIEPCSDNINTNDYNVGWVDKGEWMQYSVNVEKSTVYDIHIRVASNASGGKIHFEAGDATITPITSIPSTGGWQNWQTIIIPNVVLDTNDRKLKWYADQSGFNISSFQFIESNSDIASLPTAFIAAKTIDEYNIQINTNKHLEGPIGEALDDFEINVDGTNIPILSAELDENNSRIIKFKVDYLLKSTETIKISYNGTQVKANDGSLLEQFSLKEVENLLFFVHQIPTRIQAEDFSSQSGIVLESTTDSGGGENIGFLDPGDFLTYEINVTSADNYDIAFRTAAEYGGGEIEMQLIDSSGNEIILGSARFPVTNGWQTWNTTTVEGITLPSGRYALKINITDAPFNMNWFEFLSTTSNFEVALNSFNEVKLFPNPSNGLLILEASLKKSQNVNLRILDSNGKMLFSKDLLKTNLFRERVNLDHYPNGLYYILFSLEDGSSHAQKWVKH